MSSLSPVGRLVDAMIRRSVRARFRNVYWRRGTDLESPVVFYANHHGWMDGYLAYLALSRLGLRGIAWAERFDDFPLFRTVGALPFPANDPAMRAGAFRQTVRRLRAGTHSLFLFPEGVLHRPPEVLPFRPGIESLARLLPQVPCVPVGIRYEMSVHERPEAWLTIGRGHAFESLMDCQARVVELLQTPIDGPPYSVLHPGTPNVNERWGRSRHRP
ncbi:MAG: 1-acyl-sn-glycerol-3-phosphate acyltransferase [Fimbriimonadaceae bacterium]|nr:1-acyl-sn-glycerol-3-phosphate acyltransferase [Fimbriimonadaceae bacterium]